MTEDSASAGASDDATPADYEQMIEQLDIAIEEALRKVRQGRVYDAEKEKVRIKWIRALAYAVNIRRQVTQDRDLEELTRRIEELEASGQTEVLNQ